MMAKSTPYRFNILSNSFRRSPCTGTCFKPLLCRISCLTVCFPCGPSAFSISFLRALISAFAICSRLAVSCRKRDCCSTRLRNRLKPSVSARTESFDVVTTRFTVLFSISSCMVFHLPSARSHKCIYWFSSHSSSSSLYFCNTLLLSSTFASDSSSVASG